MAKMGYVALALVAIFCIVHVQGLSDDVEAAWEQFQAHHPSNTKSHTDAAKRKGNFVKTHEMIQRHNKNKNAAYQLEHNDFSVMDEAEKKLYTGAVAPSGSRFLIADQQLDDSMRQIPTSLDYRTNTCLAPVKNQGSCGSCWAFTAITPLEFAQCKKSGSRVILSEQQLVDCDPNNGGCNGGWYTTAWNYLRGGSARQSAYSYTAVKGTCKFSTSTIGSTVATYGGVTSKSPSAMQAALVRYGPLSVAITVINSFYSYKSGVYTDAACDNKGVNHGVVVVGWGNLSGTDYWIVRNSWGSGWGSAGYILMQRGVNKCSIETYPAAVASVV
ncbi:ervatamin-B-like [Daphnia pulicaria]|uniref:ervatamin-B-like n=1 Tax=Daphnia pulicaria TaxID=35523 RepID=UPI001EEB2A51|nr:ervatamin-B-like [Daphnia pulicaria]